MTIKNQLRITKNNLIENNTIFKSVCFNSYVGKDLVGYLKLKYIPQENLSLLSDCIGYLIIRSYFDDPKLLNDYKTNNKKNILSKFCTSYLNISKDELGSKDKPSIDELYLNLSEKLEQQYNKQRLDFINYWVNKPSIELVRVFSDKDIKVTDYSDGIGKKIERTPIDWQKKGIGSLMYEEAIKWCSDNNLELWASKTRTEESKHVWKKLEHLPIFLITLHQNLKNLNSKEIRPSVKIKIRG